MRKAAAGLGRKATSRRRQAQEQQYAEKQEEVPVTSPEEHKQPKQVNNDEQALTAKNYRLAKELVRLQKWRQFMYWMFGSAVPIEQIIATEILGQSNVQRCSTPL